MNNILKQCPNCGAKNANSILAKNYFICDSVIVESGLIASAKCNADARLGNLVREGILLGRSYGVANVDGKMSPNLKEINDWLISEGIKPFGETANKRHSLTNDVPDTTRG